MSDAVDPFVLTGFVSAIDVDERRLRVGEHDVWASSNVQLDRLRPGTRIVVNGHRNRATGRSLADRLVVPLTPRPVPSVSEPASRPTASSADGPAAMRTLQLVVSLLIELCLEAQVLECVLLPSDDRHAVRLHTPGFADRAVLLPRRALERALVDPVALQAVRTLVRSAAELLRRPRAPSDVRDTWYDASLGAPAGWAGPRCARCQGPLLADESLVVEGESRKHVSCPPVW